MGTSNSFMCRDMGTTCNLQWACSPHTRGNASMNPVRRRSAQRNPHWQDVTVFPAGYTETCLRRNEHHECPMTHRVKMQRYTCCFSLLLTCIIINQPAMYVDIFTRQFYHLYTCIRCRLSTKVFVHFFTFTTPIWQSNIIYMNHMCLIYCVHE